MDQEIESSINSIKILKYYLNLYPPKKGPLAGSLDDAISTLKNFIQNVYKNQLKNKSNEDQIKKDIEELQPNNSGYKNFTDAYKYNENPLDSTFEEEYRKSIENIKKTRIIPQDETLLLDSPIKKSNNLAFSTVVTENDSVPVRDKNKYQVFNAIEPEIKPKSETKLETPPVLFTDSKFKFEVEPEQLKTQSITNQEPDINILNLIEKLMSKSTCSFNLDQGKIQSVTIDLQN